MENALIWSEPYPTVKAKCIAIVECENLGNFSVCLIKSCWYCVRKHRGVEELLPPFSKLSPGQQGSDTASHSLSFLELECCWDREPGQMSSRQQNLQREGGPWENTTGIGVDGKSRAGSSSSKHQEKLNIWPEYSIPVKAHKCTFCNKVFINTMETCGKILLNFWKSDNAQILHKDSMILLQAKWHCTHFYYFTFTLHSTKVFVSWPKYLSIYTEIHKDVSHPLRNLGLWNFHQKRSILFLYIENIFSLYSSRILNLEHIELIKMKIMPAEKFCYGDAKAWYMDR